MCLYGIINASAESATFFNDKELSKNKINVENINIVDLIQQNQALIHKIAMIYARSDEEAQDLFQEICIQLFKSYKSFNGKSKLSTWIYRVGINTSVSWVRKEKKHNKNDFINDYEFIYDDSPFYVEAETVEVLRSLYKAIGNLAEADKTLVLLYLEETSYAEIGEILGISQINVRVKMNRLKKTLKKMMQHEEF